MSLISSGKFDWDVNFEGDATKNIQFSLEGEHGNKATVSLTDDAVPGRKYYVTCSMVKDDRESDSAEDHACSQSTERSRLRELDSPTPRSAPVAGSLSRPRS